MKKPEMIAIILLISTTSFLVTLYAWAALTKVPIWIYGTNGYINSVAMPPNGSLIAVGTGSSLQSGSVYLLDRQGDVLWRYSTNREITSVAISSDGKYIAAGGYQQSGGGNSFYENGEVYFFSNKGNLLWNITTGQSPVFQVLESTNGSRIAVGSSDSILYLNNLGNVLWNYTASGGRGFLGVTMSKNGSYISFMGTSTGVLFLNSTGALLWSYSNGSFGLSSGSISMTSDGSYLVAGSGEGGVYYFDKKGDLVWKRQLYSDVLSVSTSSNGSYVSAGTNWGLSFYDRGGNVLRNYSGGAGSSLVSLDGSHVLGTLWGTGGDTVSLLDSRGNLRWSYSASGVYGLAISDNGSYVVAASGSYPNEPGTLFFFSQNQNGNGFVAFLAWISVISQYPRGFWIFVGAMTSIVIGTVLVAVLTKLRQHKFLPQTTSM